MTTRTRRMISAALVICVTGLGPIPAQATLVTSAQAAASEPAPDRSRIAALLDRDSARALLVMQGVDPAQARQRIDALTDDEARRIARHIDEMPAGGEIIGVLFTVFIVLLVTDILGLTHVYPFTRPIR